MATIMYSGHKQNCRFSNWRSTTVLAILLVLPPAIAEAQGKGDGVEVRAVSPAMVDATPGEIMSFSFRVTSTTDTQEEFIEFVELPAGWQTVIPTSSLALEPAETAVRVVAITIPRRAPAGSYELTYEVRGERDYAIQDSETVTVAVVTVADIALLVEETPDTTIAGDEYQAKLRVINQGNAEVTLKLTARSASQYPSRIEPDKTVLSPGGSEPVLLTVKTDKQVTQRLRHVCQVTAQIVPADGDQDRVTQTIIVDVLPRAVRKFDPYHRIPAKLTARALGGDRGAGFQLQLEGEGNLSEQGNAQIEFLFRGPDVQNAGFFGQRSEYRVNYAADDFSVLLGDHNYTLSRLTDYAQYGRGLGFSLRPASRAELGAHYMTGRWLGAGDGDGQVGAYASSYLGDRTQLKLNLLHRTEHDPADEQFEDTVWSVESNVRPVKDMTVELEYGRSSSTQGAGVSDDAYRVEIDGSLQSKFHYSFNKIHAGPYYRGSYRDSDYLSGAMSVPLLPGLRGRASYQSARRNLELRTDQSGAPEEHLLRAGLHYAISRDLYVSLDSDSLKYHDLVSSQEHDCREQALGIGVGGSGRDYSFRVGVRLGTHQNLITSERTGIQYYSFYGSYRPSRRHLITLYAGTGSDRLPGARLLVPSNNLGLSAAWEANDRLDFRLNYLMYGGDDQGAHADLCATYREPDDTTWMLQVRRIGPREWHSSENTYMLSYTQPVFIPAGKKESIGILKGLVYDAEDAERRGIRRAVLSVGSTTATTDRDGRFVFGGLPPGTHSVSVERDSIGLERTTTMRLPLEAEVKPGEVTELDIGVTTAAALSGVVRVGQTDPADAGAGDEAGSYIVGAPGEGTAPEPGAGLEGVLVELADGDEVHRRLTGKAGEFSFTHMRPGQWRLKVYDYSLPPFHAPEPSETTVELKSGDSQEVTVDVLPRRRRIQMIDTGEPEVITTEPAPSPSGEDEPGPGHQADQPSAGADQPEPPSTEAPPRDEMQRQNGRKVLPPPGKVKLIDKALLRRSPSP